MKKPPLVVTHERRQQYQTANGPTRKGHTKGRNSNTRHHENSNEDTHALR